MLHTKIEHHSFSEPTTAIAKYLYIEPSKEVQVQQRIERARRRFHQWLEGSVLEDMKCLFALANREFIEQRSVRLLSRLVISQHFMRKKRQTCFFHE